LVVEVWSFLSVLTVANSQCSGVNVKHLNHLITLTQVCGCDILHNSVRPLVKHG